MDDLTIQAYDRFAEAYDQGVVAFWKEFPRDFLEAFASTLPGKRVLNVGSGSGRDALLLQELGLDVTCVDAAPRMVDITQRLGFASFQATFNTLETLPFGLQVFDGIWAHGSLIHITKQEAGPAIRKLRAFLAAGGLFAVGVIDGRGEGSLGHDEMPGASRFVQFYQDEELQDLVVSAGFTFLQQRSYVLPYGTFLNHLYVKA